MNAPVRVLVIGLPRMLREIVEDALADAPGLELVGDGLPVPDLIAAVRGQDARFVVGDADALSPVDVAEALRAVPELRVLALSHDGRAAALHELRPFRQPLGEASSDRLVAIIREHAIAPMAT